MGVEALADLGNDKTAGGALEQANTQALFELGDALAQPGLGDAQGAAGSGKPAVFDHGGEEVQIVEVLQRAFHRNPSFLIRNNESTPGGLIRRLSPAYRLLRPASCGLRLRKTHETPASRCQRAWRLFCFPWPDGCRRGGVRQEPPGRRSHLP